MTDESSNGEFYVVDYGLPCCPHRYRIVSDEKLEKERPIGSREAEDSDSDADKESLPAVRNPGHSAKGDVVTDQDPTVWFDQIPPLRSAEWPVYTQWCPRHWAPCPMLGANGIGATTELMQIFLRELTSPEAVDSESLNRELRAAGHICCKLGDEKMYELWGRWGPS